MKCKVVFLDRDGTINVDCGYVHRVEDWQLIEGAATAIRVFGDAGYAVAVVTNQSGVGAGLYSEKDVLRLHRHMITQLKAEGAAVDAVAFCPHAPQAACACRKPATGMARLIQQQLGRSIDYRASWTVGDKTSDVEFGAALGTKTALIRSPYWVEAELSSRPDSIVTSLYEAATRILVRGH